MNNAIKLGPLTITVLSTGSGYQIRYEGPPVLPGMTEAEESEVLSGEALQTKLYDFKSSITSIISEVERRG